MSTAGQHDQSLEILRDATETFRKKRHGDCKQKHISITDTLYPLPGAMNRWGLPVHSPRPPERDRIPEGEQPIYASVQSYYTRNRIHLLRDYYVTVVAFKQKHKINDTFMPFPRTPVCSPNSSSNPPPPPWQRTMPQR